MFCLGIFASGAAHALVSVVYSVMSRGERELVNVSLVFCRVAVFAC